jgi:hypothetical protein
MYVPLDLTLQTALSCPHSVFLCFISVWQNFNWLFFGIVVDCVLCEVGTESLAYFLSLYVKKLNSWDHLAVFVCLCVTG